jgi:hypothetical protein
MAKRGSTKTRSKPGVAVAGAAKRGTSTATGPIAAGATPPRQAVVVVHGIGEQTPMETMRGFVDAVWRYADGKDKPRNLWVNPSKLTGSHEMRLIATSHREAAAGAAAVSTDFYELYWADCVTGTTREQISDWFAALIWRNGKQVPADVRTLWIAMVAILALSALLSAVALLAPGVYKIWASAIWGVLIAALLFRVLKFIYAAVATAAIAALIWGVWATLGEAQAVSLVTMALAAIGAMAMAKFVVPYLGDIGRYVRQKPPNIAGRQAIRTRGLTLLKELHEAKIGDKSWRYDRIVIAGHSLGTLIAMDLIALLWNERKSAASFEFGDAEANAALAEMEAASAALPIAGPAPASAHDRFVRAQRALFQLMQRRQMSARWIISDFVSLGSPISHADFLMAKDKVELTQRQRDREIPRCPPIADRLWSRSVKERTAHKIDTMKPTPGFEPLNADATTPCGLFFAPQSSAGKRWGLHHAAPFAVVRWTNIYDRDGDNASLSGDLVSGPLNPEFGGGVLDVKVRLTWPAASPLKSRVFTHTLYWDLPKESAATDDHLKKLRKALDLGREVSWQIAPAT